MSELTPIEQIELDAILFGVGYGIRKSDGQIERVDPKDIIVILLKEKDSDDE